MLIIREGSGLDGIKHIFWELKRYTFWIPLMIFIKALLDYKLIFLSGKRSFNKIPQSPIGELEVHPHLH